MTDSETADKPFISIIVPMYNEGDKIRRCLEALIQQSYPKSLYEVIVVSDGSTDNSENIVESIINSRPGIFMRLVRQKNSGAGAARNLGVEYAKGEILLFIDSDCKADISWLEEMVRPLLDKREVSGVQGAYMTEQTEIPALFSQIEFEERYEKLSKMEYVDFIGSFSAAYKRNIFEKHGGFNTMLIMNEDVDFAFRVSESGEKLSFSPNAVVYHQHPDTLSKYLKIKFWRGYWRTIIYKKFKEKTFRDSYTPATLKLQVMLSALLAVTLLPAIFMPFMKNIVFGIVILNSLTMIGFIFSAAKKSPSLGVLSIGLLWLRSFAIAGGSLYAAGHLLLKDNFWNSLFKRGCNDKK